MTESNLAGRSQPTSSSHGLLLPTAREGSKVHFPQARPPATFHLQGLATLLAVYALRSRAGSISHQQRSWDSPFGAFTSQKVFGGVTARINPPTVSPTGNPTAETAGRPGWAAVPGFSPSQEFLAINGGLVRRPLEAPLGFNLPGLLIEGLARAFTRAPLTRFTSLTITRHARRRPRVSIGLQPASPADGAETPSLEKRPS
jgi:hypothetical protein